MKRLHLPGTVSALLSAAAIAACVGSDPSIATSVQTTPDAATAELEGGSDNAPPTYGIFFTSQRFAASFCVGKSDLRAYVDRICSAAAESAGLAAPSTYHAMIEVLSGADALEDANFFRPYGAVASGRWCAIAPSPPHPSCDGTSEIFPSPLAIAAGPAQSLNVDEKGAQNTGDTSLFLSGVYLPTSATVPTDVRVENCSSWGATGGDDAGTDDAGSGEAGAADAGPDDAGTPIAGIGRVLHAAVPQVDYAWIGSAAPRACGAGSALPLLCMQRPE